MGQDTCWCGDAEALADWYRRYLGTAFRFARRVVRDPYLAEDVAQQAMVKAIRALGQFQHRSTFDTWLYRVTINEARGMLRRRVHREAPLPLLPAVATDLESPEEAVQRHDQRQAVRTAIGRLDPVLQAAVVYRYYMDLSEAEIAALLGCPVGTVKSRLHRARQQLRSLLPTPGP